MKVRLPLRRGFHVGPTHGKIQAATMNLNPGDKEGGPDNRHRGSDQWLFVIEGTGLAVLDGRRKPLRAGTLLVIERGTAHEIRNTGKGLMKTLNLYNPPAYRKDGEPLKRGKSPP
jgi:mannose-6-phosphate isomerase-like protein (cupin superfamily)